MAKLSYKAYQWSRTKTVADLTEAELREGLCQMLDKIEELHTKLNNEFWKLLDLEDDDG